MDVLWLRVMHHILLAPFPGRVSSLVEGDPKKSVSVLHVGAEERFWACLFVLKLHTILQSILSFLSLQRFSDYHPLHAVSILHHTFV